MAAALPRLINHSSSWRPPLHSLLSASSPPLLLSETAPDEQPTQREEPLDEDEEDEDEEEDEEEYHYVYEDEEVEKEEEDERKSRMSESQDEDKTLQEVKGL